MSKQALFLVDVSPHNKWKPISVSPPALFGKASDCTIRLDDQSISGNHAEIKWENGDFVVIDCQSTNGTRVNGSKVDKEVLRDGDMLGFGYLNFMVRISDILLPRLYHEETGQNIALAILPFNVGRAGNNQLVLSDASISNRHAVFTYKDDQYFVEDLGSTNGVRVNGRRVRSAPIADRDNIKIGRWEATFLCGEQAGNDFFLLFLEGERAGEKIPVSRHTTIGRTADNDVVVPSTTVSTHHAAIFRKAGRYWIKDLRSSNGTRVSGIRVKKAIVKHGDEITVGSCSLLFVHAQLPQEKFFLVFLQGNRGGEEIELTETSLLIGRDPRCQLRIDNKDVSNIHAEISARDGSFILRDRGSTNGTYLNQKRQEAEASLQHGDKLQIGSQQFIFRSSGKARPQPLREESFVLLPLLRNGYGKPIQLGESLLIGKGSQNDLVLPSRRIDTEHARIIRKKGRYEINGFGTQPTLVNGAKINWHTLEHGDEIAIGRYRYIFKSNLRPLTEGKLWRSSNIAIIAAVAAILLLSLSIYWFSSAAVVPPSQPPLVSEEIPRAEDKNDAQIVAEFDQEIARHLRSYRYQKAMDALTECLGKIKVRAVKTQVAARRQSLERQHELFQRTLREISDNRGTPWTLAVAKGSCYIKGVQPDTHSLILETTDQEIFVEYWENVPLSSFLELTEQAELQSEFAPILAQIAAENGLEKKCEQYIIIALAQDSSFQDKANSLFAQASGLDTVPPGGFAVYEGRLLSISEKEKRQRERREQNTADAREQQQIERQKSQEEYQKEALAAERKEFELRFPLIEDYVRTYSFDRAKLEFTELLQQLTLPQLRRRVSQRLAEIEPMTQLFSRLITSINKRELANDRIQFGRLQGQLVEADSERFKITIAQGSAQYKWYQLPPERIYEFFNRMWLKQEDLYAIGVFCFENELLAEGNTSFIAFIKQDPQQRRKVDQYLSRKYQVPIPRGGFVSYQGRLISPDERKYLKKGMVRYGDKWVTVADKEKLEAGHVQYKGEWITKGDRELIAKGYVKYKDKWHTRAEIDKIRSNWEDAWTLTTDHYHLRSNISEQFIEDWGKLMEKATVEYNKFFGKEVTVRMTLYAFKGYEDYRNYCLNVVKQPNLLRAGGFADDRNNTAVGWRRSNNKELLQTMIHEGAHLYQYNAHPRSSSPSWIAEGIATQFEGFTWNNGELKVDFIAKNRLYWLKSRRTKLIPIEKLIHDQALVLINQNVNDAVTFYAQCWGIYYFFTHTSEQKYQDDFAQFIEKVHSGQFRGKEGELFQQYFGENLDELEQKWKAMVLSLR